MEVEKRSSTATSEFKNTLKSRSNNLSDKQALIERIEKSNARKIDLPVKWVDVSENIRADLRENSPEFNALVNSIKEVGLLQPIVIRPKDGKLELISGHRRLAAWKKLTSSDPEQFKYITAVIHRVSDRKRPLAQLVENANRENLHPIDLAEAYKCVQDEGGYKIKDLAELFGKSPDYVSRNIKIALWPTAVKEFCRVSSKCSLRLLHKLAMKKGSLDSPEKMIETLKLMIDENSSEATKSVKKGRASKPEPIIEERLEENISNWVSKHKIPKKIHKKYIRIAEQLYQIPEEHRRQLSEFISLIN